MKRKSESIDSSNNVNAAMCGLVRGVSIVAFKEKLAYLPVFSNFSKYRVLDVFAELEASGKIVFDDSRGVMTLSDDIMRKRAAETDSLGLKHLESLGIKLAEICPT